MEQEKTSWKEEIYDFFYLVKTCLASFWFWLPILFTILIYTQILIFIFLHPLLLLVAPTMISIYALIQEKKRLKVQFRVEDRKILLASDPLGSRPHASNSKLDIEEAVEEYARFLKEKNKKET
jgi:hypothetical protein